MRRSSTKFALLAVVLVFLFASSSAAALAAGNVPSRVPPSNISVFKLKASNHFRLEVMASNTGGSESVSAHFFRGDDDVTYQVIGRSYVTRKRVRADFGRFGSINVRFAPRAGAASRCVRQTVRGTFRGRIEIAAENHLTEVETSKAKGILQVTGCGGGGGRRQEDPQLRAKSDTTVLTTCGSRDLIYAAQRTFLQTAHSVLKVERHRYLTIYRFTVAFDPLESFVVSPGLRTASVSPGPPFAGQAVFEDGTLTGDLKVSLLGLDEPVALTPATAAIGRSEGRLCSPGRLAWPIDSALLRRLNGPTS